MLDIVFIAATVLFFVIVRVPTLETGETGISRNAILLVCIGVQIAWNGIKVLLESVTLHVAGPG